MDKKTDNIEKEMKAAGSPNPFGDPSSGSSYEDENKMDKDTPDNMPTPQHRPFNFLTFIFVSLILTVIMNIFSSSMQKRTKVEVEYSSMIELVKKNMVDSAKIQEDEITFLLKNDVDIEKALPIIFPDMTSDEKEAMMTQDTSLSEVELYTGYVDGQYMAELFEKYHVRIVVPDIKDNTFLQFIISWIIPLGISFLLLRMFSNSLSKRMGGLGGVGNGQVKRYDAEVNVPITFDDVAGQDEAKESLEEIIDFLNNPEKYAKIGAQQPKGALLVGPPGTGKTLLARAVAGESHVPFYSLSGSSFIEMFAGVGAKRVRELFEEAERNAPSIIFIDEIDAIGKTRDTRYSGNDEREQTLNQLLAAMDGFDASKGTVVLAATNRPEILDPALLRPGRFDRRIIVERPDVKGREAILEVHAKKVQLADDVNLEKIALITNGATGADLANMINEAALRAVKMGRDKIIQEDLQESVEVVIAGKEKKDRIMSEEEKMLVSYHEVGHALTATMQKSTQTVEKITIVPRTHGSLGYTLNMPEEERYLMKKDELLAQIVILLGGRAAEEVMLQTATTGASDDIKRATSLARNMVTQYGMSDTFGLVGLESVETQYLDGQAHGNYSDQTGAAIDEEVKKIINDCYTLAKQILEDNKEALEDIAQFLFKEETITGKQFMEILKKHVTFDK